MLTRRDLAVALIAVACTWGGFAVADQLPLLGSAAFDWNAIAAKPTESGSVRSFFTERTATVERLEVHETTLNPGKSPHPPHRHPNEEMILMEKGTVEALVNGEWKRVGPGSVIFFASNQLHGLRNAGSEPAVYHVVNWKTSETPAETAK
ncbi:MAG TPA: cupin domain-containing protein [Terracidiphilus sp.]|jgi:quercetin dioxygenase-like cupin family protein